MTVSGDVGLLRRSASRSSMPERRPTVGTSPRHVQRRATPTSRGRRSINPGQPMLAVNGHTDDNGGAGYTINGRGGTVTSRSTNPRRVHARRERSTGDVERRPDPGELQRLARDGLVFNKTLRLHVPERPGTAGELPRRRRADHQRQRPRRRAARSTCGRSTPAASDTFSRGFAGVARAARRRARGPDVDFPNDLLVRPQRRSADRERRLGQPATSATSPASRPARSPPARTRHRDRHDQPFDDPSLAGARHRQQRRDPMNRRQRADDQIGGVRAERELHGRADYARRASRAPTAAAEASHTESSRSPTTGANPAGSFAVVLTDSTQAGTHILITIPTASNRRSPTTRAYAVPYITYDPENNQIVVADNNGTSFAHDVLERRDDDESDGRHPRQRRSGTARFRHGPIAASSDGHVAVVVAARSAPEAHVYDNTAARNPQSPIPSNGATDDGPAARHSRTANDRNASSPRQRR